MTSVTDDKSSESFQHHSTDNLDADLVRIRREQLVLSALLTVARGDTARFRRRHGTARLTHRSQLVTVGRQFAVAATRHRRSRAVRLRLFRLEIAKQQRDLLTVRDADFPRTFDGA